MRILRRAPDGRRRVKAFGPGRPERGPNRPLLVDDDNAAVTPGSEEKEESILGPRRPDDLPAFERRSRDYLTSKRIDGDYLERAAGHSEQTVRLRPDRRADGSEPETPRQAETRDIDERDAGAQADPDLARAGKCERASGRRERPRADVAKKRKRTAATRPQGTRIDRDQARGPLGLSPNETEQG